MTKNKKLARFPLQITRGSLAGFVVGLVLVAVGFFAYTYFSCGKGAPTNGACAWNVTSDCKHNCFDFSVCCKKECGDDIACLTNCAKEKKTCVKSCRDCCEAKFEECDKAYDENGSAPYSCTLIKSRCLKECGSLWQ